MVGKPNKKKKVLSAHERSDVATVVELGSFDINSLPSEVASLLNALASESTNQGQIKLLESHKRKLKVLITNSDLNLGDKLKAIGVIMVLYLHPRYSSFQIALEWISSCLCEQHSNGKLDVVKIIEDVGVPIWNEANIELSLPNSNDNVFSLLQWMKAVSSLALFNRDLQWLKLKNETSNEISTLSFVGLLVRVLETSAAKLLRKTGHGDDLSAPEYVQWGTCCTQSLRDMVTILRPIKESLSAVIQSAPEQWKALINTITSISLNLLAYENTPKDSLAGAGSLLFIILFSQSSDPKNTLPGALKEIIESFPNDPTFESGSSTEQIAVTEDIQSTLVAHCRTISPIARCALLRSLLAVYDYAIFTPSLFFKTILTPIFSYCSTGISFSQLYGLQTLETWLSKMNEFQKELSIGGNTFYSLFISPEKDMAEEQLLTINKILCVSWGHPSRQISHIVIDLYEMYLKSLLKIWKNAELTEDVSKSSIWNFIIEEVMNMPNFHRGKYQAMKLLMDVLGIPYFLALQPNIISLLLQNMKERDIAASISTLLTMIIRYLIQNQSKDGAKILWEVEVVNSLSSEEFDTLRQNIGDYLLPEICKISPVQATGLLKHAVLPLLRYSPTESIPFGRLWCIVQILLNAKLSGNEIDYASLTQSIDSEPASAQQIEDLIQRAIQASIIHHEDSLRLAALLALVISSKSSQPIFRKDYETLTTALSYSLKTADVDECSKMNRVIKHLLMRLKANIKPTPTKGAVEFKGQNIMEGVESLEQAIHWLFGAIKSHYVPGIPFDREYALLSLLMQILDVLYDTSTTPNTPEKTLQYMKDTIDLLIRKEIDASFIQILCNGFLSNWDKSRKAVMSILLKLPVKPWTGYEDGNSLYTLVKWGKQLAVSARLRESDAGAQMLNSIFTVYCIELGWDMPAILPSSADVNSLPFHNISVEEIDTTLAPNERSCIYFLNYLYHTLDNILTNLDTFFTSLMSGNMNELLTAGNDEKNQDASDDDEFPLAHGVLFTIKLCLLTLSKRGFLKKEETNSVWSKVTNALLALTTRGLYIAMNIVAEAKSDVQFAPLPLTTSDQESGVTAKGPINSSVGYSMVASYVNTNSFVSVADDGSGCGSSSSAEAIETLGLKAQRTVVAAWLLVKESTALLSTLVEITPIPPAPTFQKPERTLILLQNKEIENIGNLLLDALGRLKHMGAIAEAHVALQAIATVLLRYGEKNLYLSSLPKVWLTSLLQRLFQHQQVFILRRSAGFAYSFLSLLRAEPANSTPVLLHQAMTSLLEIVEAGIVKPLKLITDETSNCSETQSNEQWKLSVHALNVLRLILLDGAFGQDLDNYIPKTLSYAVIGFASSQWAVRNSSMMVFSATIQRTISREKNDSGGISSVTADDYFHHYPSLFPFLQDKLHEIVNVMMANASNKSGEIDQENSLYPLLLLFAKFRASLLTSSSGMSGKECEDSSSDASKAQFDWQYILDDIQLCLHHSTALIRQVAARAYSALITVQEAPLFLTVVLEGIQARLSVTKQPYRMNEMQGDFLLCKEIITQIHKLYQQSYNMNHVFFNVVQQELSTRVLPAYFGVLRELLGYYKTSKKPIWYLSPIILLQYQINELLCQILNTENAQLSKQEIHVLWLEIATNVVEYRDFENIVHYQHLPYVGLMLKESLEYYYSRESHNAIHDYQRVHELVMHSVSEIREGVILGLSSYMQRHKKMENDVLLHLLKPVLAGVQHEPQPHIAIHYMQTLYKIIIEKHLSPREIFASVGSMDILTILSHRIYTNDGQGRTLNLQSSTPFAIEIYSYLIKDMSQLNYSSLTAWLQIISLAASEDQPYDYRLAAAKSIASTMLLHSFIHGTLSTVISDRRIITIMMSILLICTELLQDDDDDVRLCMNEHLCWVLEKSNGEGSMSGQTTTVTYTLEKIRSLFQVVFVSAFHKENDSIALDCLAMIHAKWQRVVLHTEVMKAQAMVSLSTNKTVPRKIFEAEQANIYIEKMKYAELLVLVLADTMQFPGSEWLMTQVEIVTVEVLQVLESIIQQLDAHSSSTIDTIYDGELFNYLYSSLLLLREVHAKGSINSIVERKSQFEKIAQQVNVFHPHIIDFLQELCK